MVYSHMRLFSVFDGILVLLDTTFACRAYNEWFWD